jgi:hypothetical protein
VLQVCNNSVMWQPLKNSELQHCLDNWLCRTSDTYTHLVNRVNSYSAMWDTLPSFKLWRFALFSVAKCSGFWLKSLELHNLQEMQPCYVAQWGYKRKTTNMHLNPPTAKNFLILKCHGQDSGDLPTLSIFWELLPHFRRRSIMFRYCPQNEFWRDVAIIRCLVFTIHPRRRRSISTITA